MRAYGCSRLWPLFYLACLVVMPACRGAEEPDRVLVQYGGKSYTCRDLVGLSYAEGLAAVAQVERRYGPEGLAREYPLGIRQPDLYCCPDEPVPPTYLECYHRHLAGAVTWFLLDQMFLRLEADYPEPAREAYDREMLDERARRYCHVMQCVQDAETATFLAAGTPSEELFRHEIETRGLVWPDTTMPVYQARADNAPLLALHAGTRRWEVDGQPTLWAAAQQRLVAGMTVLVHRILLAHMDDVREAFLAKYGVYPVLVLYGCRDRGDAALFRDLAQAAVPETGVPAPGSLERLNQIFRRREPDCIAYVDKLSGTALAAYCKCPPDTPFLPRTVYGVRESGSPCRWSFFFVCSAAPEEPWKMVDTLEPHTFEYQAAAPRLVDPVFHGILGNAQVAEWLSMPPEDKISRCTGLGIWKSGSQIWGVELPGPFRTVTGPEDRPAASRP